MWNDTHASRDHDRALVVRQGSRAGRRLSDGQQGRDEGSGEDELHRGGVKEESVVLDEGGSGKRRKGTWLDETGTRSV